MAEIRNRATLDTTQFQAGLQGMQGQVQGLSRSLSSLPGLGAALSVAGLVAIAKKTLDAADEIDNLSTRLGINVNQVQVYDRSLKEAGLSMSNLESAITRLNRQQAEAANGNEKAAQSFADLGISMEDVRNLNTEQMLELVGMSMGELEGDSKATAASFNLLGQQAGKLGGVLIDVNRNGIQQQIDKFAELGLIVDERYIQSLNRSQQSMERAGVRLQNFTTRTIGGLITGYDVLSGMVRGVPWWQTLEDLDELAQKSKDAAQAQKELAEAARQAAEAQKAEDLFRQAEETAKIEIAAFHEKLRLQKLTSEQLEEELKTRLMNAQVALSVAMDAEDGRQRELQLLKEIHDIEDQISKIPQVDHEAEAKKRVEAMVEAARVQKLTNEELLKELTLKRESAVEAVRASKTWQDRETHLKEVVNLTAQINRLQAQEEAAKNQILQIQNAEKLNSLTLEQLKIEREVSRELEKGASTYEERLRHMQSGIELQKRINDLEANQEGAKARLDAQRGAASSHLRRIGGGDPSDRLAEQEEEMQRGFGRPRAMTSGEARAIRTGQADQGTRRQVQVAERQLQKQDQIHQTLERMEQNMGQGATF